MDLVQNMVLSLLQPLAPLKTQSFQRQLQHVHDSYVMPYLFAPVEKALFNRVSAQDVFSMLVLLVLFVISLKVLDYARRVIMWWISLAFQLIFWTVLLGGVWHVYNVGPEKAARDVGWIWGWLEGLMVDQGSHSARPNGSGWRAQGPELRRKVGNR